MNNRLLTWLFLLISLPFYGQVNNYETGRITGKVIDKETSDPIEYANILLYNKKDSLLVTGTITNSKGRFVLDTVSFGEYFLEYRFIGYQKNIIDNININAQHRNINLKTITLKSSIENLNEVSVEAEKKHIEYKIDKKVINVSKDINSAGGTAVDVLENVPSIKIDLQGNVSLRGSQSFILLIDGKPTVMDPSKELKFIQASTIDKIEIITNPSAKYDPEGVSGIINIITKKDKGNGLNGSVNVSVGTFDKYSIDARLNYKIKKIRLIGGIGYYDKITYSNSFEETTTTLNDTINHFDTEYNKKKQSTQKNVKIGLDYFLTQRTTLGFYFKYQDRSRNINNLSSIQSGSNISNYELYLKNTYKENYSGKYLNFNLNFSHDFKEKKHNLTGYTYFSTFKYATLNCLDIDTTDNNFIIISSFSGRTQKIEDNKYFRNISKLDYTKPIGKKAMLEAGYAFTFVEDNSINKNLYYSYDNSIWENVSDKNNLFLYSKQIHSIYGTFKSNLKKLKYELGLRVEHYTRITEQEAINDKYTLSKFDFFPSIHLQYKISKSHKIQTSYSRRVNRFWGTQLNPFPIYLDANNISKGNPQIQPEYINSFELNYLYYFKSSYFSSELYHRRTNDVLGEVQILQTDGSILHTYENINTDYSTGLELMLNLKLRKWWIVNTSFNYYQYEIIGKLNNININNTINSYDFRLQHTFKLKYSTKIQLTGYYSGPSIYIQEKIEPYYRIGMAIKKSFLNRKLNITIRIHDIFNTDIYQSTINGQNYIINNRIVPKFPLIYLQIMYKIG